MKSALIGFTGFVGSNLCQQHKFTDFYNSKNISDMQGQVFDLVVCAGVSAVKWQANKEPELDWLNIQKLAEVLKKVKANKFILISTIDVYPVSTSEDEDYNCMLNSKSAYGLHRLKFELFCQENFDDCTVVRLPGLFGDNLKKNVLFDLLNDNCLEAINPYSSFQYYFLGNLWRDVQLLARSDIKIANFFSEPILTNELLESFFPNKKVGVNRGQEVHYDLHTKHASIWGKHGKYAYNKLEIMEQVSHFIEDYHAFEGSL